MLRLSVQALARKQLPGYLRASCLRYVSSESSLMKAGSDSCVHRLLAGVEAKSEAAQGNSAHVDPPDRSLANGGLTGLIHRPLTGSRRRDFQTKVRDKVQRKLQQELDRKVKLDIEVKVGDGSIDARENVMLINLPEQVRGNRKMHPIPYTWLRDHCRCSECVNPETMQRSYDVFSAPPNIQPTSVELQSDALRVKWNDGHQSLYKYTWLNLHLCEGESWYHGKNIPEQVAQKSPSFFTAAIKDAPPPSIDYEEVMSSDDGVAKWMRLIHTHGFSYVDHCPVSPEKTKELLERICFIRQTHYGGFYDFTSDLTMKDTAYTTEALDAHTDTTYFTDPASHQMFHLLSHTDGSGGESLLVDGFYCANVLWDEDPEAFLILADTSILYHSSGNEGISIRPRCRTSVLSCVHWRREQRTLEGPKRPILESIRWNRYDRATLGGFFSRFRGGETLAKYAWYEAARKWNEILKRPENQYWEQLKPGRPIIIDNNRVMHGRAAFTGNRRMCGGYLSGDDYLARFYGVHYCREEILERV